MITAAAIAAVTIVASAMIALSDGVTIALVVFIGGLCATASPILLASMTNRANMASKRQDWDRQDEVAARAAKATEDLLTAQQGVVTGVVQANETLTEVAEVTKVTHALVNSDKTAQMREKRDSMAKTLLLTRELADLKGTLGKPPSDDLLAAMTKDQTDIDTLDKAIEERLKEQHLAEEQIAADKISPPKTKESHP
jgi:hypothetical protein